MQTKFFLPLNRSMVACCLMLLFVIVSCMPALAAPIEVNFWSLLTGGDGQIMNALIDRFNEEHDGIVVTHTILDWGDPYYSKLLTSMVGGAPPAIGIMHDSRLASFAEKGLLTPFTDKDLEKMGVVGSDFIPTIWEWAHYNGVNYAIPLDIHPYALYINVEQFEQAGIPPASPRDEEEFILYTNLLKRDFSGDGTIEIAGFAGLGSREWLGYLKQYGGQLMDEQGMPAFNTDAGRRALEFQRELIRANSDQIVGWFGNETAAMQLLGPWEIGNFQNLGINFVTDVIPQVGPEKGTWAGSHLLVVPAGVKEQTPDVYDAALVFISWLSLNTIEWSAGAGHVPARVDRLTVDSFIRLEPQQAFARSLDYAQFWPDHRLEGAFHNDGVWPYLTDQIDVSDALARMELSFMTLMFETDN